MEKSFEIQSIFAGWFHFRIKGKDNSFALSYLDDVKWAFDKLFILENGEHFQYLFDMEGQGYLLVQTYSHYNSLFITLRSAYYKQEIRTYLLDYEKFLKDYIDEWNTWKDSYLKDFAYHEDNYKVDFDKATLRKIEKIKNTFRKEGK